MREDVGALEAASEPPPRHLVGRKAGDVAAAQQDPAAGRRHLAGEEVDERRLAGAVRPDDGVDLARLECERDVVDRGEALEALRERLGDEDRLSHGGPRARAAAASRA
jgi:hypothetical protein